MSTLRGKVHGPTAYYVSKSFFIMLAILVFEHAYHDGVVVLVIVVEILC